MSFDFMAAVNFCSDFGAQENKVIVIVLEPKALEYGVRRPSR